MGGASGDGALLRVANDGAVGTAIRGNLPTVPQGTATIGAGATLTGIDITLNSSGKLLLDPTARLIGAGRAPDIAISSQAIALGANAASATGTAIVTADASGLTTPLYGDLSAASRLRLSATGAGSAISFLGNVSLVLGTQSEIDLDAAALKSDGGSVAIGGGTVNFVNSSGGSPSPSAPGSGTLTIAAQNIDLGQGDKSLSGFAGAALSATQQILLQNGGSLNAGAANLLLATDQITVANGASQSIATTGMVTLTPSATQSSANALTNQIGGALAITGGAITDATVIEALAGNVTLEATTGDVILGSGASIIASGYAQQFFDVASIANGGTVTLISDLGNVSAAGPTAMAPGSLIDVSAAKSVDGTVIAPGGNAGRLVVEASNGDASLDGSLLGAGPTGGGGSISLDANSIGGTGASSINSLAGALTAGGFNGSADLRVRQGDIHLSSTMTAHNVALTADTGAVTVTGQIDASGNEGGSITLIGGTGVDLSGATLLARGTSVTERGGQVDIETSCNSLTACRGIVLGNADIDVSGGTRAGLGGGTVLLRAPVIANADATYEAAVYPGAGSITGARSVTLEAYQAFAAQATSSGGPAFDGIIDPAGAFNSSGNPWATSPENTAHTAVNTAHVIFYTQTLANFVENFRLADAAGYSNIGSLGSIASLEVAPGIELDNSSTAVNGGNITVASAWNLGAGTYDPSSGTITNLVYRTGTGNNVLGAPGILTIRAANSVNIDAAITDGFFNTAIHTNSNTLVDLGYDAAANLPSPAAPSSTDPAPIAGADLFPLVDGRPIPSWSYRIVAGADFGSANPLAVAPLAIFADGGGSALSGQGNVVLGGHTAIGGTTTQTPSLLVPTMVRTGTGFIDVAAARDIELADHLAPGVIYTAGVASPVVTGFTAPTQAGCHQCTPSGAFTVPAYPQAAGDLSLAAQQDIEGFQAVTSPTGTPYYQFWAPWLMVQSDPIVGNTGGMFAATGGFDPLQTSWWIDFGGFDQGFMSAGGDVTITAGRNLQQVAVSLPTTGRVSGGLGADNSDIALHTTDSGNLTVTVGGDIVSGSFYVGDGSGDIRVGGSVVPDPSWTSATSGTPTANGDHISTVLAVDNGALAVSARGSIDLYGVVSPISLQNVWDPANPTTNLTGVPQATGNSPSNFVSSYGPASAVSLQTVSGDILVNSLLNSRPVYEYGPNRSGDGLNPLSLTPLTIAGTGVNAYPASFAAVSMRGDVDVAASLQLAPSNAGSLDLIAYGNLVTQTVRPTSTSSILFDAISAQSVISTGPSLASTGFDPFEPWNGFDDPLPTTVLLHQSSDQVVDHFYALTGSIVGGGDPLANNPDPTRFTLAWDITVPAEVEAGLDILDLNFHGQNLSASDVTSIIAGRDITYAGPSNAILPNAYLNFTNTISPQDIVGSVAALRISGPGYFDVEAGRNLGPFLLGDPGPTAAEGQGIVALGNAAEGSNGVLGNGLVAGENGFGGIDPFVGATSVTSNIKLPVQSANVVAMFGIANGVDHQAVVDFFIDPAGSSALTALGLPVIDYSQQLADFLSSVGGQQVSAADAFPAFQLLEERAPQLADEFVLQVFFAELKLAGNPKGCCNGQSNIGYRMIDALFPVANGYTDNFAALGPKQVGTGDLNLLHSTIQTQQGGSISILGPGGSAIIGSLGQDTAPLTDEGVLTIAGGGVNTFTDGSFEVNQSRVFTEQGGDIVMWSSNGDLDAGRGKKTTASFPPLAVEFPTDDTELVDLAGLVTGAGIAALQSTPDAPKSDAYLIAPHGAVNAGNAGIRVSGDLSISAQRVENAGNISVGGTAAGVPVIPAANIGAALGASAATGQGSKVAEETAAGAEQHGGQTTLQSMPSLITVEVLGYGGVDTSDQRLKQYLDCSNAPQSQGCR